jgi:2-polyprenyl-3-methyl-5-hydroxy-6-metoxy-1,4-benzoquinol methylase
MKLRAEEILLEVRGHAVLDIGCAGHLPEPTSPYWLHGRLRERFDVVGIDVSEDAVAKLKEQGFSDVLVGDAQSFDLDHRFDTIVAGEVIEHVGRPEEFLRTAARHLKPGGRIVLTTPYPFSLFYFLYALKNFPRTCVNPEHTMWFCPSTLTELASRAGLRVDRWRLIIDLEAGAGSPTYRAFANGIRMMGWLLPKKLRCNGMLFVLTPVDGSENDGPSQDGAVVLQSDVN